MEEYKEKKKTITFERGLYFTELFTSLLYSLLEEITPFVGSDHTNLSCKNSFRGYQQTPTTLQIISSYLNLL